MLAASLLRRGLSRFTSFALGRRAAAAGSGVLLFAVLAGGAYAWHEIRTGRLEGRAAAADLAVAERDRDSWRALAQLGVDRVELLEDERREANAAVARLQVRLADREVGRRARIARIRAAPPELDGPVAPVLVAAIEALP